MDTTTKTKSGAGAARGRIEIEGLTSEQMGVRSETPATYVPQQTDEDRILEQAETILRKRWARQGTLSDPRDSEAWLRMHCAGMVAEVFGVIFLDNKHRILQTSELFRGTIDGCSIPPREVVRAVIECNAAAVILYHNHPSGSAEPSSADVAITQTLKQALDLVGCRVLDHLVIGETVTSLSQRGLC